MFFLFDKLPDHGKLRFAVGYSAGAWCTHSGRNLWVKAVHVQADMKVSAMVKMMQSILNNRTHSPFIYIPHGEDANAKISQQLFFTVIKTANPDKYHVFRS